MQNQNFTYFTTAFSVVSLTETPQRLDFRIPVHLHWTSKCCHRSPTVSPAVPLMSLLYIISQQDCRPWWQSLHVLIIIQHFTTGLRTTVAVHFMSSLLSNLSLWNCGLWWQSISCPHHYPTIHYRTADRGGSSFNVLIIIHPFTMGLRTAVAVSISCPHYYPTFHYRTADRGGSPFNVLITI